jgi:predicted acylesterase/phospholipase RssA
MSPKDSDTAREGKGGMSDTKSAPNIVAAIATLKEAAAKDPEAASAAIAALEDIAKTAPSEAVKSNVPKRAICLGGGGPAVGLHIGALEALKDRHVDFGNERSVWALSCIGAWVGVIYNQAAKGQEIETTYNFFHDIFRDNKSFESFPTNTIFAPDWAGYAEAIFDHLCEPATYRNAFLPREIMRAYFETMSYLADRKNWRNFSQGDFNRWTLNNILAVHPAIRFLSGLVYKTRVDGRARLFYKDSNFLKHIKFGALKEKGKPFIFHNAYNFATHRVDLFANDPPQWHGRAHKPIGTASLCACSALPFVEETVKVNETVYCEGALVDTVNFKSLLKDHNTKESPLQEIWINRIVDTHQIHKPKNLHDALANLCQLFAATVGEDDVKLFKHHVKENNRDKSKDPEVEKLKFFGTIIEIEVSDQINFHWSHENLDNGRRYGAKAATDAIKLLEWCKTNGKKKDDEVLMIPDDLKDAEIAAAGVELSPRRKRLRAEKGLPADITADERASLSRS